MENLHPQLILNDHQRQSKPRVSSLQETKRKLCHHFGKSSSSTDFEQPPKTNLNQESHHLKQQKGNNCHHFAKASPSTDFERPPKTKRNQEMSLFKKQKGNYWHHFAKASSSTDFEGPPKTNLNQEMSLFKKQSQSVFSENFLRNYSIKMKILKFNVFRDRT